MEISIVKPELSIIQTKIHEIRGVKVILDYDLAELYRVETRVLNQSVKRNEKRFPKDFMFQLTENEFNSMSSQIVMTYPVKRPKSALPNAFTEQGVAMLSGLLNSNIAIEMNIAIMRAFVAIRHYALNYSELNRKLDDYMKQTDTRLDDMCEVLDELITQKREFDKPSNPIGFDTHRK